MAADYSCFLKTPVAAGNQQDGLYTEGGEDAKTRHEPLR